MSPIWFYVTLCVSLYVTTVDYIHLVNICLIVVVLVYEGEKTDEEHTLHHITLSPYLFHMNVIESIKINLCYSLKKPQRVGRTSEVI